MNFKQAPERTDDTEAVGLPWDKTIDVPLEDDEAQELSDLATARMIEIDDELAAAEDVFDDAKAEHKSAVRTHAEHEKEVKEQLRNAKAREAGVPITVTRVRYWEIGGGVELIVGTKGKWKGIRLNTLRKPVSTIELYDISQDIAEQRNLAQEYPDIVADMARIMEEEHEDQKK